MEGLLPEQIKYDFFFLTPVNYAMFITCYVNHPMDYLVTEKFLKC